MAQPRAKTDMPLDRNESYWLIDEELLTLCKSFDERVLSTYPDYDELKHALAAYAGVSPNQICITPGSDAAIETIARVLVGKGNKALLPVPTFYGYEAILKREGVDSIPVTYIEKNSTFVFPQKEFLATLADPEIKAAFICSPNNPLGIVISSDNTDEIVEHANKTSALLVSDEAYFEYSGYTLLPHVHTLRNLIIVRTLSKGFGIPGARIGYCIASPEIISSIESHLLPWPIAHTSFFIATTLLRYESHVRERRELVIAERERFIQDLRAFSYLTIYPSETNFVLIRTDGAKELQDHLSDNGIRVVSGEGMSSFPDAKALLKYTIRIAIPSPNDRGKFFKALETFTNKSILV
jgi:histidinol-phosphate aminotransferase